MRWTPGNRGNIEDRRGSPVRMGAVPMGIGGVLLLLVLSWFTGVDFLSLVGDTVPPPQTDSVGTSGPVDTSPAEERLVDFVDAVMADTQSTWEQLMGSRYQPTRAVLFRDATSSTCGFAESAVGPFYCPADRRVYLDLSFFNELRTRFAAPGEFAQAYVLAHEIGHHVQTLTGVESGVRQQQQSNPGERNQMSVLVELQADCFAGVWGHKAAQPGRAERGQVELDPGDLEDGLRAASAIGDDTIQKRSSGRVMPDKFTHGSSEQRVAWFRRGFETGDPNACNTFQR
jgi:predicted metalloprotease